jgi:translation initiation factor 5B
MSGEGVPDLLMNLILHAQNHLQEKLMYFNYLQCTVLEVKVLEGLGWYNTDSIMLL